MLGKTSTKIKEMFWRSNSNLRDRTLRHVPIRQRCDVPFGEKNILLNIYVMMTSYKQNRCLFADVCPSLCVPTTVLSKK